MPDLTPDRALRRPPPPGAREAAVRTGRRRRWAARSVVGVAALLVAVPVVLAVDRDEASDRLLTTAGVPAEPCPDVLPVDAGTSVVPPPSAGPPDRLVPAEQPLAALVCRYEDASAFGPTGRQPESVALEGERRLAAGLERLPDDLAVPRGEGFGGCSSAGGPVVPHLLRLDFPSGSSWVSTSTEVNSCVLSTNGSFTAAVYLGSQVAAAYDAGAWVDVPEVPGAEEGCPLTRSGRAGQEDELVPDGWAELVLCETGSERVVAPERAAAAADLLNGLSSTPGAGAGASCSERQSVPGDDGDVPLLRWRYPSGRDVVVVLFVGCDPAVANTSRDARPTVEQQAELLALLEGD